MAGRVTDMKRISIQTPFLALVGSAGGRRQSFEFEIERGERVARTNPIELRFRGAAEAAGEFARSFERGSAGGDALHADLFVRRRSEGKRFQSRSNRVEARSAGKFAKRLFGNDEIQKRHSVLALISAGAAPHSKGDSWGTLAASPPGMLQAKSYDKQYTLQEVKTNGDQQIAVITMNAVPSSKRAPDMSSDSKDMGFFAKMFEDSGTYDGELVLNLSTGQIINYQECLKAEWVAAESPEEQKSDKGPDTLTMGFTHLYSIEKIND